MHQQDDGILEDTDDLFINWLINNLIKNLYVNEISKSFSLRKFLHHWYPSLAKNYCWFKCPSLSRSASSMNYWISLSLIFMSKYWLNTALMSLIPTTPLYFLSNKVKRSNAYSYRPLPKNHFFVIISMTSLRVKVYLFS